MSALTQDLTLLVEGTQNPLLVFIGIVLSSFILEDAAAVLAALAVAGGHASLPVALGSLFVGIAAGDMGLFAAGRFAARHPWAQRWVATDRAKGMQEWLNTRLIAAVISVRFIPGARLPTYTACGFLGMPFIRFALAVIAATLIWTSLLFTFALGAGNVIMTHFGAWRWPASIVMVVAFLAVSQYFARRQARRISGKDSPK